MVSKQQYISEISEILKPFEPEILNKFEAAYDFYLGLMDGSSLNASPPNIDELIAYIFKGRFNSYSVPMEFINSPAGNVLFSIKFGAAKKIFTSKDIRLLLGITRGLISHDLGKTLIAFKDDKPILVYENEVISYMKSKGLSEKESKDRIEAYIKLSSSKASDEEISKSIDFIKHKYSSTL